MATVVLGAQWGDEGKGKLVDILCSQVKICARAQGGHNAGHTIVANGISYDFHLLPSGLLNPKCLNLIGSGVVVHVPTFFSELAALEKKGLENVHDRIFISDRCQIDFDLHTAVDGLEEVELGSKRIGTTRRGIGPTYSTKAARTGVRLSEVFSQDKFEDKLRSLAAGYKKRYGDLLQYEVEDEIARFKDYRERLRKYCVDAAPFMADVQKKNIKILVEGANALMLDLDWGTYPYVTSSNTGLGGIFTGLALDPTKISSIIGVVKAYTTRVGGGPLPTEDTDEIGTNLQEFGREWGVSTGRRRRCGWLDLVVVKYSASINHYTAINLTKLDVLDSFPEIKIATAYSHPETKERIESFPADLSLLEQCNIVYETIEGWQTSTTGMREWGDLPKQARRYVEFIEKFVEVPVKWVGTGPRREDIIQRGS